MAYRALIQANNMTYTLAFRDMRKGVDILVTFSGWALAT